MANIEIYKKRIQALIFSGISPIIAIAPFLIGFLGSLTVPNCNESNCGWGVLPWFSFFTIPIGFGLFITGAIRFLLSLNKRITKTETPEPEEKKLKLYFLTWLTSATSPIIIIIGVVLFAATNVTTCNDSGCVTETSTPFPLILLILGAALYVASLLFALGLAWTYGRKS